MKTNYRKAAIAAASSLLALALHAHADVVTDWNIVAGDALVAGKLGTPPANRVIAIVQTAVDEAVQAALPHGETAVSAAVAAANRVTLAKLIPSQDAAVGAVYQAVLAKLPEGAAKAAGIAAGEQAAAAVLARRADDGAATPERYRPHAAPGAYVPTASVATPQWPQRKPWALASASQFRPGPPPALNGAQWARDYDEVKTVGSKTSTKRTAEQTEVARFWEFSLPPIYHGVLRSVALSPGRSVAQNARLFATASQAMDDATIAVFDAKYHYNFWRPATAIRNGDTDGNDVTTFEAGWSPLIDTPMHPEYPSAHSIIAGSLTVVLKAEAGANGLPVFGTSSPSAQGATRQWKNLDDFVREVGMSRLWAGIHYRNSIDVGLAMGRKVGEQVVAQRLAAASPVMPAALVPVAASRLVERVAARGVQVYECRADAAAPTGAQWVFVAPQAELFDAQGASRGTHYAGPHWEAADGSKIVGKLEARADAPQSGAIPWLLLSARSVGEAGRYAGVTSVQRINTAGGLTPSRRCDAATVGVTDKVPYTADYLLFAS